MDLSVFNPILSLREELQRELPVVMSASVHEPGDAQAIVAKRAEQALALRERVLKELELQGRPPQPAPAPPPVPTPLSGAEPKTRPVTRKAEPARPGKGKPAASQKKKPAARPGSKKPGARKKTGAGGTPS
jgi:hypothetical protein